MTHLTKLDRRSFLKLTGVGAAGLALHATINTASAAPGNPIGKALLLNVFVQIGTNNRVTILAHRSEMGQGIRTSLPQVVADELDADWDKVDVLQAEGDKKYGDQETDGSHSVRDFYQTMREMGASAKLMLVQAAAAQWRVPVETCVAKDHRVTHASSGKSLSYGELAEAAAKQPVPDVKKLNFKSPSEFKYIGKPVASVDLNDIVRGSTTYGIDTHIEGMVYASIERCPVLGGKVKSFDATKAKQVKGVLDVIKIDGGIEPPAFNALAGVAVIATNTWAALQGRKQLQIVWETSAHDSYDSRKDIAAHAAAISSDSQVVRKRGDVDAAFAKAAKIHEAVYTLPHLEHATMEPPAAMASITGDSCEVWACTQSPQAVREQIVSLFGFKHEKVKVNVTLLGECIWSQSKIRFCG